MKKLKKKRQYSKFIQKHYDKIFNFNYSKYFKYQQIKFFVTIIIIFFSLIIYLSLPAFYNNESFDKELKNKIYKDFKIDLKNIKGITYNFVPTPHFIIETTDLFLKSKSEKEIAKITDLKVLLFTSNLHKKEKIKIKSLKFKNANFYLNGHSLKSFYNHLHANITKPIYINNSNFFYADKNDQIITISPLKKFKYFIDLKNKEKLLNISGKLFDIDYNFKWKKDYLNPKISNNNIKLKNPDIKIFNQIEKDDKNNTFQGFTKTQFLNNEINILYSFDKNKIEIKTENDKPDYINKIKLNGLINLNPFFFNIDLNVFDIDFNLISQKLFSYMYSLNNSIHPHFNGNLNLKLSDLNNRLFEDISFNFSILEEQIQLDQSIVNLKNIGKIKFSNLEYIEKSNEIFLKSIMELEINNQDQFYRRFQIPKKNRINLKNIFFDLEKNIDKNIYIISNIKINFDDKTTKENKIISELETYQINNIQQLTKIIKKEFQQIN